MKNIWEKKRGKKGWQDEAAPTINGNGAFMMKMSPPEPSKSIKVAKSNAYTPLFPKDPTSQRAPVSSSAKDNDCFDFSLLSPSTPAFDLNPSSLQLLNSKEEELKTIVFHKWTFSTLSHQFAGNIGVVFTWDSSFALLMLEEWFDNYPLIS